MDKKVPFEIKQLDNMITRRICHEIKEEKVSNFSHVQVNVLKYLYQNKDKKVFQSDIEKTINARRSTISGILKTMEKNGLIKREICASDSRKKEILLTDKSIIKYKEMKSKVKKFENILLKDISCEEQRIFFDVIDKLKNNLREEGK